MKRLQRTPTDDWQQLQLLTKTPAQRTYELIRPVVLFGQPATVRAQATGVPQRTLYRQADAFDRLGMASLAPPPQRERHLRLPAAIRQAIVDLKRAYSALNTHEITTICWARFGQRPSPHTVKRILAEAPPATPTARRFPPYHDFTDPTEARLAVIRLHIEGWNATSTAGYLGIGRTTVYRTLQRWVEEGVAGLPAKSHARTDGPRQVTLRAIATAKELQANPALGEWRLHTALKQQGVVLSPRTCGRILALNRKLYGLARPAPAPHTPKPMPFAAQRRHQIWSVDLRYLDMHRLGGGNIYVISILDNYSRAILASGLSRTQDLTAYLLVLYAAIRQHGGPEALVSDGGGIFKAKQALRIYDALGIRKEQIDRRQPWPGAPWAHTSRPPSMCSAGWPIGISRRRRPGPTSSPSTISGWSTTTTRTTGRIGSATQRPAARRRCSPGSTAVPARPKPYIGSSTPRGSGGPWIARVLSASGTGASMARRASPATKPPSGCTANTSRSSSPTSRSPSITSPTSPTNAISRR